LDLDILENQHHVNFIKILSVFYIKMAEDKSYIIDPLTSLCKMALLHFMPEKTRLAISHHVLYVQGYSYYQWIERMRNGDSRIDISYLNAPLIKAIKWYILDGPDKIPMDQETSDSIRTIAKFAVRGLVKMQTHTYHNDIAIKIILQYFINMLRDALAGIWMEEDYIKSDSHTNVLANRIKNNYDSHTINSICKILNDANELNDSPDDINALVECAHKLLVNKDNIFVKMMKEVNTSL
jgi:hypothetical protein